MTELFRNPVFANAEGTRVDVEIEHPELGWIGFTAAVDDPEMHSRWLYAQIVKSEVAPYVPPPPPPRFVQAAVLWRRLTDEEAERLSAAMSTPLRIRKLFETAALFVEGDDVWPHLRAAATELFGEARAAELLAPPAAAS